jgi:hypothetical protein
LPYLFLICTLPPLVIPTCLWFCGPQPINSNIIPTSSTTQDWVGGVIFFATSQFHQVPWFVFGSWCCHYLNFQWYQELLCFCFRNKLWYCGKLNAWFTTL